MNKENTVATTAAPLTVREEIDRRLAAIKPEDFIAPDIAPEPNAHFVCTATDEIRRLFTLRNLLAGEGRDLATKTMTDVDALTPQNLRQAAEALEESNNELSQLVEMVEMINRMCWLEVKRQHPILRSKSSIAVYSDWSLCWNEDVDRNRNVIARVIVSRAPAEPEEEAPQPIAKPHKHLLH